MTIIFILAAILLLFALASLGCPRGIAWTAVRAAIAAGGLVVALTELLNATLGLNVWTVSAAWAVLAAILGVVAWRKRLILRPALTGPGVEVLRWFRGQTRGERFLAWFIAAWFAVLLVVAVVAAPNNRDSLTYRLPRVMAWANNESVEFFQTQIMRQNTRPPFSEWSFLHLYLTTNSDRLFNCVQWCAFVLCALAAVELAKMLGADRRARLFALLLVATTPLAILQSTSTQNDLVSAFLTMAFVLFGWRLASADSARERMTSAVFCGLSLGLCALSKPTLLPIVGVGGIVFGLMSLKRSGFAAIAPGIVCVTLALVLSAGHFHRNYEGTQTLFGSEGETHQRSEPPWTPSDARDAGGIRETSPRYLASNMSRNLALLLSSPMVGLNDFFVFLVWRFHDLLGISVNEPAITFQNEKFSLDAIRHEDVIGNLPQVALFLLALCLVLFRKPCRPSLVIYSLAIITSFAALSAVLPWQPWHTRVFLPLVLLACPLIAAALPLASMGRIFPALCGALVVYAFPFVTENETRPVLGEKSIFSIPRFVQFTRGNYESYAPYHQAVRNIRTRKYRSVGLLTEVDDPTYQLWPILNAKRPGYTKLYQIDPNNMSLRVPPPAEPDAVLVTFKWDSPELETSYGKYHEVWREGPLTLFERAD